MVMGLWITGCGNKEDVEEEGTVTTITFSTIESLPVQREFQKELLDAFYRKHPEIKVKIDYSLDQKVKIQMAGGTAPDVFYWVSVNLPPIVNKGQVLNLEPLISTENRKDFEDFFPQGLESCRYEGKLYALPIQLGPPVLFYNKDIFDKSGMPYPDETWTWDSYLGTAQKLTRDLDGDGRIEQYGASRPNLGDIMKCNGVELFNENMTEILFDTQEFRSSLQYLVDLKLKYNVIPSESMSEEMGGDVPLFSTGKLAMFCGSSWMLSEFSKIKNFQWDIALIPRGKFRATGIGIGVLCISSYTKHPDAAWKFVNFYASKEGLTMQAKIKQCVPSRMSVATSPVFNTPPPEHMQVFIDAVRYASMKDWVRFDKISKLDEWDVTIKNYELKLAYLGKQSVEETVRNIVSKTKQFIKSE